MQVGSWEGDFLDAKKTVYIDHNIFIETLKNKELYDFLDGLKAHNILCFYSPAHIEEVYKVLANNKSHYKNHMENLLQNISRITNNYELLPSSDGIKIKKEDPQECLKRVRSIDTRERVEHNSISKFNKDKKHYQRMISEDKHNQYISTLSYKEIWNQKEIQQCINDLNENMDCLIDMYNRDIIVQILKICNIKKELPLDFSFKKNNYDRLKKSHTELEYTIEILFRILNNYGYYAEKTEKTAISSTHDITHAIYATKADYFISTDERFYRKCEAVYHYIGAYTKILYCRQMDIITLLQETFNL